MSPPSNVSFLRRKRPRQKNLPIFVTIDGGNIEIHDPKLAAVASRRGVV